MGRTNFYIATTVGALAWGLVGDAQGAEGRLVQHAVVGESIKSNIVGISPERSVLVYLPPSYEESAQRYPVVYVLHGILDSNTTWTQPWGAQFEGYGTLQDLMNRGIESGTIEEMLLVIPDADKSCHYTDSPVKGNWESFIVDDLVGFVDQTYRTKPAAATRGIMGHSMGGHGAIKIAMKHPDKFGVVYALNPSLLGWGGDVSTDNEALMGLGALRRPEDIQNANFYVQAIVGVGQCLSPNPDSPFLTDFPFETDGEVLGYAEPAFDRWTKQMPLYMIPEYADNLRALRGLRFDSAFEDEYAHIPITALAFSRALEEAGLDHRFEMYNGDHRNRLWGRSGRIYTEVLPYFSSMLENPPSPTED